MSVRESLISSGKKELEIAFRSISRDTASDVYAISFYVWAHEDDVRRACITVGFNTEENAANQRQSELEEARWNYAMWLQNSICEFPDHKGGNGKTWQNLLNDLSINYTDQEADDAFDAGADLYKIDQVSKLMVDIAVELSKYCHSSGLILSVFGKPIPIIVHELEYYATIAIVTKVANPPGLAEEFMTWMEPCFHHSEGKHDYPNSLPEGKFYF